MKVHLKKNSSTASRTLDGRLAAYLTAAGAVTAAMASEANAIVIGNNVVQPFGVNGAVNIDFNSDGQTDFQIDHDRVTLPSGGPTLDYLQIDKNDVNGEANPLAFDPLLVAPDYKSTPFSDGLTPRNNAGAAAYVISGAQGSYPAALTAGTTIGPSSTFDFQEINDFNFSGKWIRANRLIDEDATQIDQVLGGQPASGVQIPLGSPNFIGLGGAVRYLGVKMDLNNAGQTNYGWIGIHIPVGQEADATGEVVGYAYESVPGASIAAGTVPEPGTIVTAILGGAMFVGCFFWRRLFAR